jgi:hypothetical protein
MSCCNYQQDLTTQQAIAQFLPKECLSSLDSYSEILKPLLCAPCTPQSNQPTYLQKAGAVTTLYVCDYYAKQIYSPGINPAQADLSKPTSAFDFCGFYQFAADGLSYTIKTFASQETSTAQKFFNSASFKSKLLNDLGPNF